MAIATLPLGTSFLGVFNLEVENEIFQNQGIEAFRKYQLEKEDELLEPGTAFYLVKSLLELNRIANKRIVEVVVMSRNSPETGFRVLNSIDNHKLDISRVAFTGGEPLSPYIDAYDIDLFLSKIVFQLQTSFFEKLFLMSAYRDHLKQFLSTD